MESSIHDLNKILQNLINTGEVISFIDDVIVKTKEKKRYNEVVEEVVKRLALSFIFILHR